MKSLLQPRYCKYIQNIPHRFLCHFIGKTPPPPKKKKDLKLFRPHKLAFEGYYRGHERSQTTAKEFRPIHIPRIIGEQLFDLFQLMVIQVNVCLTYFILLFQMMRGVVWFTCMEYYQLQVCNINEIVQVMDICLDQM